MLCHERVGVSCCWLSVVVLVASESCLHFVIGVQYYLKTGTCKFGATCKYHHPRDKAGSTGRVHLNVLGLPLRPVSGLCPIL